MVQSDPHMDAKVLRGGRKWRKPLTERGLRNAERCCAIVEGATPETRDNPRVIAAVVALAWTYAPRLLADLKRVRQGALVFGTLPHKQKPR